MSQAYASSSPAREQFLDCYYSTMRRRDLPALAEPSLPGGSSVDICSLYTFVMSRGGYAAITKSKQVAKEHWPAAAAACVRLPPGASRPDPACVRLIYEIYLLPYELVQEPSWSEAGKRRREAAMEAVADAYGDSDDESGDDWGDEEEEGEEEPRAAVRPRLEIESRAPIPTRPPPPPPLPPALLVACVARATAGEPPARLASLRLVCRGWRAAIEGAGPPLYGALDFSELRIPRAPFPFLLTALRRGATGGSAAAAYALAFATGLGWCGAPKDPRLAAVVAERARALGHPRADKVASLVSRLPPAA